MDIKQQWESTPQWQRIFLILAIFGAAAYLIFISFISQKLEEYSNLQQKVNHLESTLNTLKAIANTKKEEALKLKVRNLKKEIDENNKKLIDLSRIIPSDPKIEDVLKSITNYALNSGLIINSFKIEKEEDVYLFYDKESNTLKTISKNQEMGKNKEPTQSIPKEALTVKKVYLSSSLSGGIDQLKNFLNYLSNSQRLIIVESLSIKKENSKLLNFNLGYVIYYMPEEVNQ
ncbi:type 4a pilus biogenesis protein PilO [Sulfurihydrogenibium azorense]|uniref:type 4a pilus biogenesis protein PilO n=1 Tax=Sulfurihydrogenibium azorense TaxID=309806 RepID=UPI00240A259B|nr:type 4a pilus biogenesis protein PilO [Sulfurihydrogenibium azorense]MDM7274083.1 type 4a pilus biogenesis protein PilO [Sulfurihydrogenibium azorense]